VDNSPNLARQEIWGLLTVYNAVVDQAVTAAVDLGIDPDEISFTLVLRATRDYLTPTASCTRCGHRPRPDPTDLTTVITTSPRHRTGRPRTSPRTAEERRTQHTRNVTYTINITDTNLLRTAQNALT
jgi:hypothetical protein